GDLVQIVHAVCQVGLDHRHGHAVDHTAGLVLGPYGAAGLLEHARPFPAIGTHPGEYYRQYLVLQGAGGRAEGHIHAGLVVETLVARQNADGTARVDHHLLAARSQQSHTRAQHVTVHRLPDTDLAKLVEAFGKGRGESPGHVLDQQYGGGKTGRQPGQNFLQGNRPAGGGAYGHQLVAALAWRRTAPDGLGRGRRRNRCRSPWSQGLTCRWCRSRAQPQGAPVAARQRVDALAEQLANLFRVAGDILEILRQVVRGAGVQGIETDPRALIGQRGEHEHGCRLTLHDLAHGSNAVHHRHLVVHGDHVRMQGQCLLHRLLAVGGCPHHLNLRIGTEDLRYPPAEEARVIHHQYLDQCALLALSRIALEQSRDV